MKTIIKIALILMAIGLLWFFWTTLIKSGAKHTSTVDQYVYGDINTPKSNINTESVAREQDNEQNYSYVFKGSEEKDISEEELFIDGSAQHNYLDITENRKIKVSHKKEDKRKYFAKEKKTSNQMINLDRKNKHTKLSKEELFNALMDAVYFDDIDKAEYLIENGAPINSQERNSDFTPVFMALSNGSEEMLNLLLEKGASLEIYDEKGFSPLHRAITGENYTSEGNYPSKDMIKILLEYGADINYPSRKEKMTPLMLCAQEHKANLIPYLISLGANEDLTDKLGRTVLDYSKTYQCSLCMRILLS